MMKKVFLFLVLISASLFSACSTEETENIEKVPIYEKCIHEMKNGVDEYFFEGKEYSTVDLVDREVYFEKATDMESIVLQTEELWFEVYGEETIINERPYIVKYDFENDNWYVDGTLKGSDSGDFEVVGGVAHIAVSKETGEVLAVWHGE